MNADATELGVLMLKPGIVLSPTGRRELDERLARWGYRIGDERTVEAAVVRDRRLIRRHYHDHFEVARVGRLLPAEHDRLRTVYDTPSFRGAYGDPATIPVVPALALAGAHPHLLTLRTIGAWADQAARRYGIDTDHPLASHEVGELADVMLLPGGADALGRIEGFASTASCFVLNPQMGSLAAWWEDGPDATVVFTVQARANRCAWSELRADFLGTGAPARWPPGSLRRDLLDGRSALHYRAGIEMGIARNGVHLSNGPIEALRELSVWFDRRPEDTPAGRVLAEAGLDVDAVLAATYLADGAGTDALSARTEGVSLRDLAGRLIGARLLRADEI